MKRTAYTLIALLVLTGSMAVAAQAQASGRKQWVADIPFQFNVADATLPAGRYTITQVNPAAPSTVVEVRAKDGGRSAMLQMSFIVGNSAKQTSLVFHRYGDKYFLAQAWINGEGDGLNSARSRSERAAQKEMAARNLAMATVAIRTR